MDKSTSLFALACLLFVLVGPLGIVAVWQQSDLPGTFNDETFAPGDAVDVTGAGGRLAVWAEPADIDLGAVTCTDDGAALEQVPDPETAVAPDGADVTLLAEAPNSPFSEISCSGGGVQTVHASRRMAADDARTLTIVCAVSTVVLPVIGLLLRRRGYRWPV